MRSFILILFFFVNMGEFYTQKETEIEKCLLLEIKSESLESRLFKKIELIKEKYKLKKEKFYVYILITELGDTVLHFSTCYIYTGNTSRECWVMKENGIDFYILNDGEHIKKFLHLNQIGWVERSSFCEIKHKGCSKRNVVKHLDIFVRKIHEGEKEAYVINYDYGKCRRPTRRFIYNGFISQKKNLCDYAF